MSKLPKRWRRPANILLVLLAALLGLGVYVAWKTFQPPGLPGKYAVALDARVMKGQKPEGPNGWDLLVAASEKRAAIEVALWGDPNRPAADPRTLVDYSVLFTPPDPDPDPDSDRRKQKQAEVEEQKQRALQTLQELQSAGVDAEFDKVVASRWAFRPTTTGRIVDQEIPGRGGFRQTARMLAAKMHVAAASGDWPGQARAFEQLLAAGRVCGRQATLVERLVGIAFTGAGLERLNEELIDFPLPPGEPGAVLADELLAITNRQIAFPTMVDAFEGERYMLRDAIEWMFTDDGSGDGWLMLGSFSENGQGVIGEVSQLTGRRWMTAGGLLFPGKKANIARCDEFFARLAPLCDTTRPVRRALPNPEEWVSKELGRPYRLLQVFTPALGKAMQSDEQIRCAIAGTRLVLAIEAAMRRDGAPPSSLESLAKARGIDLPIDPINGKGFGYRRATAESGDPRGLGRRYLLYSLGDDGIDNQGAELPDTSQNGRIEAILPGKGVGYDYVINHSDRRRSK